MKYIYTFQQGNSEGSKDMRDILGGKGANLAEMCNLDIPVPPGFTLIPESSKFFISKKFESSEKFEFNTQFDESLKNLEDITGTRLASETNPCLLSVRSGAKVSMPGMMDTVLNLGLNDYILDSLIEKTGNPYFVYDSYRRFIQTYSIVVLNIAPELFEDKVEELDSPTIDDLKNLCVEFKQIIKDEEKRLPSNGHEQLTEAIKAVYNSWYSDRAKIYRKMNNISEDIGTAVSIQAMVYGNKNDISLTGVLFSRDCLNGSKNITGEYLYKAQGEDIVSGLITPDPISLYFSKEIAHKIGYSESDRLSNMLSLEEKNLDLFKSLSFYAKKLEKHFGDVQDIEFTVEDDTPWILQARTAKTTPRANSVIQRSLFREGLISEDELFERTKRYKLEEVKNFHFSCETERLGKLLSIGLGASTGLASGKIVFESKDAVKKAEQKVILVREQTDTHDLDGILAAEGTLTARGGTTSHAAVICRGASLCCVVGSKILIDAVTKTVQIGDKLFQEGDWISLDGESGEIFEGELKQFDTLNKNKTQFKIQ